MAYEDLMRMLLAQNPDLNIPGGGFMAVPDEESARIAKRNDIEGSNALDRMLATQDRQQENDLKQRMNNEAYYRSTAITRALQDNPALVGKINPQAATMLAAMTPGPEPERVPLNIPSGTDMTTPQGAMAFMTSMLESGDIKPAQYLQGANQVRDDMRGTEMERNLKSLYGKVTPENFERFKSAGKEDVSEKQLERATQRYNAEIERLDKQTDNELFRLDMKESTDMNNPFVALDDDKKKEIMADIESKRAKIKQDRATRLQGIQNRYKPTFKKYDPTWGDAEETPMNKPGISDPLGLR